MRVIDRVFEVEHDLKTLREILADKGIVTAEEFGQAQEVVRQREAELRERAGLTPDQVLDDLLRKFQGGPKQ